MARRDAQTDPFNAGDPTMPWDGEPHDASTLDGSSSRAGDSKRDDIEGMRGALEADRKKRERRERTEKPKSAGRTPRASKADRRPATGPQGANASRSAHNDAPAKAGSNAPGDAPAKDTTKPAEKDDEHVGCGRVILNVIGAFVGLFILICIVSFLMVSCSGGEPAPSGDSSETAESAKTQPQTFDYDTVQSQLLEQEQDLLKQRLDSYVEADDAAIDRVAALIDSDVSHNDPTLKLADVGIDSRELARWYLDNTTYELGDSNSGDSSSGSDFYAYTDDGNTSWVGAAFFHVFAPDPNYVTWELQSYAMQLKKQGGGTIDDAGKAKVKAKLEELKASAKPRDNYVGTDFTGTCEEDGSNAKAAFDEDSWNTTTGQVYSIYTY